MLYWLVILACSCQKRASFTHKHVWMTVKLVSWVKKRPFAHLLYKWAQFTMDKSKRERRLRIFQDCFACMESDLCFKRLIIANVNEWGSFLVRISTMTICTNYKRFFSLLSSPRLMTWALLDQCSWNFVRGEIKNSWGEENRVCFCFSSRGSA